MKAVNLLVNHYLPDDLKDYNRPLDAKGLGNLLTDIARKYPERYDELSKKIGDIGRHASYRQGETFTLNDMRPVIDRDALLDMMDHDVEQSRHTSKNDEEFKRTREGIWQKYTTLFENETAKAGLAQGNNVAMSVLSGARGKNQQLNMMLSTPGTYQDAEGNIIPMFVRHSFAEGLSPSEMLAGTYGSRSAVVAGKSATAKGGDLSKQMTQNTNNLMVTAKDCGTSNGIALPIDEKSVKNRILAKAQGGIPAGTVLDKSAIDYLRQKGIANVIVRSALSCQAENGLCQKCTGIQADGKFPEMGNSIGITASTSIGEPICIVSTTYVRMADFSVRMIKDIQPGDMVLGSDMEGYLTPVKVLNVFHNGPRDCVSTKVRKGHGKHSEVIELISTTAHKVLSVKDPGSLNKNPPKIQPIEHPKCGFHSVILNKELLGNDGINEPMAGILGVLTGDGCYTGGVQSAGVGFSCYDPELENWVTEELKQFKMHISRMGNGEFRVSMILNPGRSKLKEGQDALNNVKDKLIKEEMWGQGSGTKTMPKSIQTWNNSSVAAYIGGLIATDGWVTGANSQSLVVGFSSNSKILLEGIKELLETRFGIWCNRIIGKNKKKKEGGVYATTYELSVTGKENVTVLAELIPIPGCKDKRIKDAVALLTPSLQKRGRFSVISQTPVGIKDTWDLEVDNETHLFALANGMIVSNTQSALNSKHTAGAVGGAKKVYSGYSWISQFVQVPENFEDRASLAKHDGKVTGCYEAPQGGTVVMVDNTPHYIPVHLDPSVKEGDIVEKGTILSSGLADPSEITELRGLGEGRNYYVNRLQQMLADSGMPADRRNVEILARGAVNHVTIPHPAEHEVDIVPDDTVEYSKYIHRYDPPVDVKQDKPSGLLNHWLQAPALHYTIGTRITPTIAKDLESNGFDAIYASKSEPHFVPEMTRLRAASKQRPDWISNLNTSNLKDQFYQASTRGMDSNISSNYDYAPRLAYGAGFGDKVKETGKF